MDDNTKSVLTLLIPAAASVLGSMIAGYFAYKASQKAGAAVDLGKKNAEALDTVKTEVGTVKTEVGVVRKQSDGMNDKMNEMSEAVGRGKGREEERRANESLTAAKAEGVIEGEKKQKDVQVRAAEGAVIPATVSTEKAG